MKSIHFYAYYDAIEETGEVIYCGKGNKQRSSIIKKHIRNDKYNKISNKHKLIRKRIPCLNEKLSHQLEIWLIEKFHTYVHDPLSTEYACNFTKGGDGSSGYKHTQDTLFKMKEKAKTRGKLTQSHRNAISQGSKNRPPISQNTHDKLKKARAKQIMKPFTPETIQKLIDSHSIKIVQYSKNDKLYQFPLKIFKSAKEAQEILNIQSTNITQCCRKKRQTTGGYRWQYSKE